MKKFKLVLALIIMALLGLFFYQNKAFFMAKEMLHFQLPFMEDYPLPEMPNAILFLACILFGLLITYFFNLLERFRANKTIKGLNATVDSNLEMISSLKNELATYKSRENRADTPAADAQEEIEKKV